MNRRSAYVVGLVALLTSVGTSVRAEDGANWVYGLGTYSCGKYLAARRNNAEHPYLQWVEGFLTAMDGLKSDAHPKRTDGDAITGWMDNYCREHPLEDVSNAAASLALELLQSK